MSNATQSAKSPGMAPTATPRRAAEPSEHGLSARRLAECVAALGHEIRTPLNVILGYVNLLSDALSAKADSGHRGLLDGIERGAKRLKRTVDAALDFARIEAGEFKPKPDRVDLDAVARELMPEFEQAAREKGLTLSYRVEVAAGVLQFDEQSLSRALTCLLDNAVKFTRQGSIAVRIFRDALGQLCLEVRDTGPGIDAASLAALFRKPPQDNAGDDRRSDRSGLGLELTGRCLSLNGARLLVASEKGRGSVFTIAFGRDSELS